MESVAAAVRKIDLTPDADKAKEQARKIVQQAFDKDKWLDDLKTTIEPGLTWAVLNGAMAEVALMDAVLGEREGKDFDPNEPRDESGRWTDGEAENPPVSDRSILKAKLETIDISDITADTEGLDVPELRPGDEPFPLILDKQGEVLDGFHRLAGMRKWQAEHPDEKISLKVVRVEHEGLADAVANKENASVHSKAIAVALYHSRKAA